MAAKLRHIDPTREPRIIVRVYAALAATRFARFISRHVNWKLDPLLLRATRGRLATTLVFPTALLETKGARSGVPRRNAIIYFDDGERITIAASNAGAATEEFRRLRRRGFPWRKEQGKGQGRHHAVKNLQIERMRRTIRFGRG